MNGKQKFGNKHEMSINEFSHYFALFEISNTHLPNPKARPCIQSTVPHDGWNMPSTSSAPPVASPAMPIAAVQVRSNFHRSPSLRQNASSLQESHLISSASSDVPASVGTLQTSGQRMLLCVSPAYLTQARCVMIARVLARQAKI